MPPPPPARPAPPPHHPRALSTVSTPSTLVQTSTEEEIAPFFIDLTRLSASQLSNLRTVGLLAESGHQVRVLRSKHAKYLLTGLGALSRGYISLDSSRPWIAYWCLHSLDLLNAVPKPTADDCIVANTVSTISSFQSPSGGFGGGPSQLSHCAPTYASVLTLLLLAPSHPPAYSTVDRPSLYRWFLSMKTEAGGFRMHDDGEVDVRGTYTVVAVAALLNMLTAELVAGVAEWVLRCQSYEGGFGGEPGNEAHGGYAFCAVATLHLLGRLQECDVTALKHWLANRQLAFEGGFGGRANKLVDGCYTFWQGGAMAVVNLMEVGVPPFGSGVTEQVTEVGADGASVGDVTPATATAGGLTFDQNLLQRYVLLCGQHVDGGLRDKPSKMRDYYHTCYNLSGLSVSQHCLSPDGVPVVHGDPGNVLEPTHPCFNIRVDRVDAAMERFGDEVCTHEELINA